MSPYGQFRRQLRWLALLGILLLAGLAGCASPPATSLPTGSFSTTVTSEQLNNREDWAGMLGDWQLLLTPEGSYTLVNKGIDMVQGSYAVSGDQITFTEESGLVAQPGAQIVYTWALEQGNLRLTAVEDDDEQRRFLLSSFPWAPAP